MTNIKSKFIRRSDYRANNNNKNKKKPSDISFMNIPSTVQISTNKKQEKKKNKVTGFFAFMNLQNCQQVCNE